MIDPIDLAFIAMFALVAICCAMMVLVEAFRIHRIDRRRNRGVR